MDGVSSLHDLLGLRAALSIRRFGSPGAFLAIDESDRRPDAPVVLLPGAEIPHGAKEGDIVDVFVYLDGTGRPVATTGTPKVELGQVAFLTVTACTEFGAFVDWGLPKELLVPFADQTVDELRVGDCHPIGLYVDKAGRLAGTMRVREMLASVTPLATDAWVVGEAWRDHPTIGLFVILERTRLGVVPVSEPHTLTRGQAARFRVTSVLPDGKIELSLRGHAHEELAGDGARILDVLTRKRPLRVSEAASPEEIRELFGLSKKAFKRAVGRLLKDSAIEVDEAGFLHPRKR